MIDAILGTLIALGLTGAIARTYLDLFHGLFGRSIPGTVSRQLRRGDFDENP